MGGKTFLGFYQTLHIGSQLFKQLVLTLGHGAADDKRCTGIVNENGVHLIDDGEVVRALHEVLGARGHVVTQVVKAELVVGTEGDIGKISLATCLAVGLVFVNTIDAQPVEHIERTHPLRVTLGQIVVDGNHMYAVAGKRIKEDREGSHEGFTFTRSHLSNLAFMKNDAAKELHVVVNHVPHRFVTSRLPVIHVDSLVALDTDEILGDG